MMLVSSVASLVMIRLSIQLAQCLSSTSFDLMVPFMKVHIQNIKCVLVDTILYSLPYSNIIISLQRIAKVHLCTCVCTQKPGFAYN